MLTTISPPKKRRKMASAILSDSGFFSENIIHSLQKRVQILKRGTPLDSLSLTCDVNAYEQLQLWHQYEYLLYTLTHIPAVIRSEMTIECPKLDPLKIRIFIKKTHMNKGLLDAHMSRKNFPPLITQYKAVGKQFEVFLTPYIHGKNYYLS